MLGEDLSDPAGNAFAASVAAAARALTMQTIATNARIVRVDIRQMSR
jgi:hypothetical protein